jgi:hypothetical protein
MVLGQLARDRAADESRRAGDEDPHAPASVPICIAALAIAAWRAAA